MPDAALVAAAGEILTVATATRESRALQDDVHSVPGVGLARAQAPRMRSEPDVGPPRRPACPLASPAAPSLSALFSAAHFQLD